jgi:hypothetical protein
LEVQTMSSTDVTVPVARIQNPSLSLASVRWATEIPDSDDSAMVEQVEMFTVVGEQYRLDSVEAATRAIGEEDGFLPPRFWLIPDDNNAFDSLAVGVYAISIGKAFHIGFLPKEQARVFREGMEQLSRAGESLEVLGCITQGKSSPNPNGRLYLPVEFARLCLSGFADDNVNRIAWVEDRSPVLPRAATGNPSDVFTFEDLCKIYCWHARRRRWFCFPHDCEAKAEGIRSAGIGLARADFEPFMGEGSNQRTTASPRVAVEQQPNTNPASQWYYSKDGREYGPFDAAGLRDAAKSGQLQPGDRVRRGDLSQWASARRVKGLFSKTVLDSPARASEPSLAALLFQQGDLPQGWSVGLFESSAPKMFEKVNGIKDQGSYPLLFGENREGGATALVFQTAADAMRCYDYVRSTFAGTIGMVARLGDAAGFSYMRMEMPPQLKLPLTENTDLVFVRGTVVIHVRMGGCQPEPAVSYAAKIDARLGS